MIAYLCVKLQAQLCAKQLELEVDSISLNRASQSYNQLIITSCSGSLTISIVPPVTAAFREAVYLDQQNSWTPTSLPASSKRGAQTSIKSFFTPPSLDAMAKRTRQSTFKCNADAACGLSFASKPGLKYASRVHNCFSMLMS